MTTNKKIPALRFKEFEGEWEEKKLGEFFTFKNGVNADKHQYGKGIKFINVLDVINNEFITYENIIGMVDISEAEFKKNEVKYGDILFQRSSETREEVGQANVYLGEQSVTFGGFVIRGRAIQDYNPYFMNNLLKTKSSRKEITDKSGGSTRYNVGQETLKEVKIYSTSLQEQQKIAAFLTAVDDKIQELTKKKALLEQYKKGVMQQIFNKQIRFKDDDGKDYPDWEEKKLVELFQINAGGDIDKANFSKSRTKQFQFPIFSNSDKEKGLFGYSDIYKVDKTSITVSGRGALGNAVARFEKFYPIVRLLVLIPTVSLDVRFYENVINQMSFFVESTGVPQLTAPQISNYKVPYPNVLEQQKIANFLTGIDNKINAVGRQLERTQVYKKGLLQQMFV